MASGNVVKLHTLEVVRRYPIQYAQRLQTQYGYSILLTLGGDTDINVKIFSTKTVHQNLQG